ncbi:MAG: hypothetical protein JNK27_06510 [Chitinophagaceae bacterium]|nr:hypothetical protein [Chitinophagaceae bacterium]
MSKLSAVLLALLLPVLLYSQQPKYIMGPVSKKPKGGSDFSVLYSSDNETILLRGGSSGFGLGVMTTLAIGITVNFNTLTIEKYDQHFKLVKTVNAKSSFGRDLLFLGTIESAGQHYIILADAGNKQVEIFKAQINTVSLQLTSAPEKIATLDINNKQEDDVVFTWSPDKSKMAFVSRNTKLDKSDKNLSVQVLDKDFKPLWNSRTALPMGDIHSRAGELSLNNNGDVFMLVRKLWSKKESKKHTLDFFYSLFKVTKSTVKEMPLVYEEYELNNASVVCLSDKIAVQGYCIERGEWGMFDDATAMYTIVTGYDMAAAPIKASFFTSAGENMFDPAAKRNPDQPVKETTKIETRSKSYYPNGDCLIAAEAIRGGEISNTVNRMTFTHTYAEHSNILLVFIKADGTIKYSKRIIKLQTQSDEDLYASVVTGWKDNKTIFLYNDDKRNPLDKNVFKTITSDFRNSHLIAATVDEEGNIKKFKCIDNANNETCIIPWDCGTVREGEIIVIGSRFHALAKTEVQVGKVIF